MTPAPRNIDPAKAVEMINNMYEELDEYLQDEIDSYINEDETLDEDDLFDIANVLAFRNRADDVPSEAVDFVKGVYLDEIALGNRDAMVDLGALYYSGRIGEQSYAKAVKYYKMAADLGCMIASENLGYCYYYGRDVEVDYEKAFNYFIKPAMAGRTESIYKIGDMYSKGLYVDEDKDFAFKLYEKVYRQMGNNCDVKGDVCLRMGNAYYYGNGVEEDRYKALKFYQQAEYHYYAQIADGDYFKRKMLQSVIEKIDEIRDELAEELVL